MWYRAERPVAYKISMSWAENVEFLACLSTETVKKMSGMVVDIIYSVASRNIRLGHKSAVILS